MDEARQALRRNRKAPTLLLVFASVTPFNGVLAQGVTGGGGVPAVPRGVSVTVHDLGEAGVLSRVPVRRVGSEQVVATDAQGMAVFQFLAASANEMQGFEVFGQGFLPVVQGLRVEQEWTHLALYTFKRQPEFMEVVDGASGGSFEVHGTKIGVPFSLDVLVPPGAFSESVRIDLRPLPATAWGVYSGANRNLYEVGWLWLHVEDMQGNPLKPEEFLLPIEVRGEAWAAEFKSMPADLSAEFLAARRYSPSALDIVPYQSSWIGVIPASSEVALALSGPGIYSVGVKNGPGLDSIWLCDIVSGDGGFDAALEWIFGKSSACEGPNPQELFPPKALEVDESTVCSSGTNLGFDCGKASATWFQGHGGKVKIKISKETLGKVEAKAGVDTKGLLAMLIGKIQGDVGGSWTTNTSGELEIEITSEDGLKFNAGDQVNGDCCSGGIYTGSQHINLILSYGDQILEALSAFKGYWVVYDGQWDQFCHSGGKDCGPPAVGNLCFKDLRPFECIKANPWPK